MQIDYFCIIIGDQKTIIHSLWAYQFEIQFWYTNVAPQDLQNSTAGSEQNKKKHTKMESLSSEGDRAY